MNLRFWVLVCLQMEWKASGDWDNHFPRDALAPTGANPSNASDASSAPRQQNNQQGFVHFAFDPWAEVVSSSTYSQAMDSWGEVPRSSSAAFDVWAEASSSSSAEAPARSWVDGEVPRSSSAAFDFWGEASSSSSAAAPARSWGEEDQYDVWGDDSNASSAEVPAPVLETPPVQRRGAPVRHICGKNATRRKSDQSIRQQKKLMGEAFVPKQPGRPPEKFDEPHVMKRQNWADKQEGLAISSEIVDPQWQARVLAHAQTRQGKKQMGPIADALNKSNTTDTMIKNCNEILKGGPNAAVTFEPDELKRLYPADVVGNLNITQCAEKLRRLGVRAPKNTLDSMRTTLARIGATGSIAGEAGVRTGGRQRAELTGRLTEGITARDAAKLLPNVTAKYINAAKTRVNDADFVPTLGENYASNTTREKISPAQDKLYVDFFKDMTDFKSGAGPHTKSRILTKPRHKVSIKLFASFPKLLRDWSVGNATEKQRIDDTAPALRTKFETDVVAAASHVEYDNSTTEYEIREAMALLEYQSRLKKNATTQRKFGKVRPASKGNRTNTKARLEELLQKPDVPEYLLTPSPGQKPCSEEVFWKILQDNGIRFTCTVRPTMCPIHEKGPSNERALKEALREEQRLEAEYTRTTGLLDAKRAQAQAEACQNEADEQALSACTVAVNQAKSELMKVSRKVLELTKEVATYKRHLEQYETSRKEVDKIMDNLGPEECLLYRDFVNQHSWYDNEKVCNLIFVLIWKENGVLRSMKLNNFCSDEDSCSTDPYYVRDVFDFHMKPKNVLDGHTGLLSRFKKIYISGRVLTKPYHYLTLSYR